MTAGVVYLVGAGPGDPGLITVRGLELLRAADVVVHDRLVAADLLVEAKRGAEIIDVGKTPQTDSDTSQDEINAILIDRAARGLSVVRLKGGDPFVFGRGFEELSACRAAAVPCVVVPGVSSAIAAPAAAGISVTGRGLARTVAIVTGSTAGGRGDFQDDSGEKIPSLDFAALARIDTLIILMGRGNLRDIAASLIAAGREPDTPAACIERATLPGQRVIKATLATIAAAADRAHLSPPMVTVVGQAAAEAGAIGEGATAEKRAPGGFIRQCPDSLAPLANKRIVLNRARSKTRRLRRLLEVAGATVINCPTTQIMFPLSSGSDSISQRLPQYDWLLFTSANGVEGFQRWLVAKNQEKALLAKARIGCVGPATAAAARAAGFRVDLVPPEHNAASLAQGILSVPNGRGARILFIRGDKALPTLPSRLRDAGVTVDEMVAYRTEPVRPPAHVIETIRQGVDAAVFFSPSAASVLFETVGSGAIGRAVCIGRTTADSARRLGLRAVVAHDTRPESLFRAVLETFANGQA